jgi:diguanylate cyclase (GGDEF)-like protein/PAS domain S-box-containing protein
MLEDQAKTKSPIAPVPEDVEGTPEPQREGGHDGKFAEAALLSMLALYPEAPVLAAGADGIVVAMPASVPLQRNPVLRPRTGMELLIPEDRSRLLITWDEVLATGTGRCPLRMSSDPGTAVMYCGFDVRATHGVVIGVVVPTEGGGGAVPQVRERVQVTPRFARVTKGDSGFIVKIDEAVTQILGWSPEEMEGHRSIEFIHPDDHALAIDNWLEMLATPGIGRRVRLRHRRSDDSWVWFEVTNNNLLDDDEYNCVVCEMVDISEEMAREQLLERLAETLPVGLFQVDADRHIVYTNDQLHQILGVAAAGTVEAQLATVVEADRATLRRALDDVLGQGEDAEVEVELKLPDSGALRFCTINMRALNHDGTISGAIACVADVTDSTRMREELTKRATFDELTGCYNRPSIMQALEASVAGGHRRAERAVMFIDLDRFKEVNDLEGHAAGDELLKIVAERLRGSVRGADLVGRIGGDEFLIVCPEVGGEEKAMRLAARVADALCKEVRLATVSSAHELRASIGVAWSNGDTIEADILVAQADAAMYESKHDRAGRPKLATADAKVAARRPPTPRRGAGRGERAPRRSSH